MRAPAVVPRALRTRGFAVLGPVDLPHASDLADGAPCSPRGIFNCSDEALRCAAADQHTVDDGLVRGDGKRSQRTITSKTRGWRRFVRNVRRLVQEALPGHGVGSDLQLSDFVLLESAPGCQRQAAHTDFAPSDALAAAVAAAPRRVPLGMLVALEPDTTLEVWPSSIGAITRRRGAALGPLPGRLTVRLVQGDVLLFRGDCVHAGSSFSRTHQRLHAYWDSKSVPRTPDTTYLIQEEDPHLAAALGLCGERG